MVLTIYKSKTPEKKTLTQHTQHTHYIVYYTMRCYYSLDETHKLLVFNIVMESEWFGGFYNVFCCWLVLLVDVCLFACLLFSAARTVCLPACFTSYIGVWSDAVRGSKRRSLIAGYENWWSCLDLNLCILLVFFLVLLPLFCVVWAIGLATFLFSFEC